MAAQSVGAGAKRRVLMVTSNYPRWAGDSTTPFVHALAVDLIERGWRVSVLAPHAPGACTDETLDGVRVHRFRYLLPERAETVCYGGGALVNLRQSRSARIKVPALVAAEWAALARRVGREADVVHAHWALPQGFVAATTPRRGVPRVLTVHGGDVHGLRGGLLDRFTAFSIRHCDRVTVNSYATRRAVADIAGPGTDVTLIPMGVDLERRPRPELVEDIRRRYRTGAGPLLVFVGRIVEEKGVEDVVQATAILARSHPGVSAVMVGDGQHRDRVRDLAASMGLGERIHLPGWADPEDVPSWFAAADAVLAPSRIGPDGWQEGQGLVMIEAMAAGAVVIGTHTGGIPESITDGESGLLVEPSDPAALARAVTWTVEHPEAAAAIAAKGRLGAFERFGRSTTADSFDALLRQLTRR